MLIQNIYHMWKSTVKEQSLWVTNKLTNKQTYKHSTLDISRYMLLIYDKHENKAIYNNNYVSKLPANRYKVEWAGYCNLLWGKLNILLYLFNNCVKPYSIRYFSQVNTWINLQQSSNRIVVWLTDWLMPFTTGFLMNTFMHDSQYPVDYNIIDAVPDPVHYTKLKWKLLNTCYVSRKVLSSGWRPRKWRIKQLKITIFAFKFLF